MSEWVDWLRWGAPELARRVNALDASPVRRGGGSVHTGFGAASPARDAVIALQQDARRTVREREALHRGALKAGLPRLGLAEGCDFLAATAAAVEAADFETLWDTGRAVTRLLARCDQVEGLAEPVRVIRGLDGGTACPACSHGVALFDGVHATCLRCRERWLPLVPLLTAA
jgi:hypothetical protein